ncbi:unnamed protein product [Didymodactylos carnosus]|uniref:UPF3 domain-containing protein n=1 Tax=Didymodactylos carnosus TaxID=1234261 RepID=A0A814AWU0_9BILA|nr:unnamed protein product [Didymodactylos carnosus]CAF1139195.1 unnamed protein product [Didymodactylos carnosus]CAF3699108.1 unnamed protein product [Didymodactylos carnosus]CAF3932019.1 unnamed protein product [Didymodactylos carnosus]
MIVLRRLPPTLTAEQFMETVSPLPEHDYFRFYKADNSLGQFAFSRAYINIPNRKDLLIFTEKFEGYVFIDGKGNEYYCSVEYAPSQRKPKTVKERKDPKLNTIEQDPDYQAFLKNLNEPEHESLPNAETMLDEIEKKQKELHANHGLSKTTTPLLEFLKRKREEKKLARDREKDIRRQRDDQRRSLKQARADTEQQQKYDRTSAKQIRKPEELMQLSRNNLGGERDDDYNQKSRYSDKSNRQQSYEKRGYEKSDSYYSQQQTNRSNESSQKKSDSNELTKSKQSSASRDDSSKSQMNTTEQQQSYRQRLKQDYSYQQQQSYDQRGGYRNQNYSKGTYKQQQQQQQQQYPSKRASNDQQASVKTTKSTSNEKNIPVTKEQNDDIDVEKTTVEKEQEVTTKDVDSVEPVGTSVSSSSMIDDPVMETKQEDEEENETMLTRRASESDKSRSTPDEQQSVSGDEGGDLNQNDEQRQTISRDEQKGSKTILADKKIRVRPSMQIYNPAERIKMRRQQQTDKKDQEPSSP